MTGFSAGNSGAGKAIKFWWSGFEKLSSPGSVAIVTIHLHNEFTKLLVQLKNDIEVCELYAKES